MSLESVQRYMKGRPPSTLTMGLRKYQQLLRELDYLRLHVHEPAPPCPPQLIFKNGWIVRPVEDADAGL